MEAGVILSDLKKISEVIVDNSSIFASQGSCMIGGNLATNAGGVNVLNIMPATYAMD